MKETKNRKFRQRGAADMKYSCEGKCPVERVERESKGGVREGVRRKQRRSKFWSGNGRSSTLAFT
jgi:hypothetical protein